MNSMYEYNGSVVAPLVTEKTIARQKRESEMRQARLSAPVMGYVVAWTTVKGVDVQAIPGMEHIVAAPVTGKRSSARFSLIDVNEGIELCQVKRSEVSAWLIGKANSLEVPKVQIA